SYYSSHHHPDLPSFPTRRSSDLYVLHNELHLHGPRFGCGLAQCGACSVLLDGKEIRSCVTPVAAVSGKAITTLEGMPALYAKSRSEEHTSELQSQSNLVCRLLLE